MTLRPIQTSLPPPKRGQYDYLWKEGTKPLAGTLAPPPPPPPERGGGNPRIRVEIEIVQRTPPRKDRSGAALAFWIVVAVIAVAATTARGETITSYKLGATTYYRGSEGSSGMTYRQGSTDYGEFTTPDGRRTICTSFMLGSARQTSCQ